MTPEQREADEWAIFMRGWWKALLSCALWIVFWACVIVAALLLVPAARGQDPATAKYAVVRVSSHGGSATAIATTQGRTLYLSAAHMFGSRDRNRPIKFEAPMPAVSGQRQHYGCRVIDVDSQNDIALFEWAFGPVPYVAPVAPAGLQHPKQLLSIGYDDQRIPPTIRQADYIGGESGRTYTRQRPWHGRSGGLLLDSATGYLWGVVGGYTGPRSRQEVVQGCQGIYASHTAIVAFLRRNGIEPGGQAGTAQPEYRPLTQRLIQPQVQAPALPQRWAQPTPWTPGSG